MIRSDIMDSNKLIEIFKDGNIVIPRYLFKNYAKFDIDLDTFMFLMYLYNLGTNIICDPNRFSNELNIDKKKILIYIDTLSNKKYVDVDVVSSDKGIKEDIIKLDGFYDKIKSFVMDDVKKDSSTSSIFDTIEKEFGRTLSPTEYEIIKAWLDNNISEDIIKEALKEAVFNGVSNLRYIDKILYEWKKLGIETVEDVEKNRKKHLDKKNEDNNVDMDIVDWNWFEDEGED